MNVLIIAGHPRKDSFSHGLADAYRAGALQAGAQVKQLMLAEMIFNLNVITVSPQWQQVEDDVRGIYCLGRSSSFCVSHLVGHHAGSFKRIRGPGFYARLFVCRNRRRHWLC
jgi:hypothetical protein